MGHPTRMASIDQGQVLLEVLDGYFARLRSVACVTIVDELMRSLAEFYDAAAASDRRSEFQAHCQSHPLHGLLLEDPFTARGFLKPRGQAADGVMLDYIYRPRYLALSEVGEAVHFVTTNLGAAQSIMRRRDRFAKALAQTVRATRKARILSIANGHLRELDTARRLLDRRDFQIFALDADGASLREAVNANPDVNIVPLEQPIWHFLRQESDLAFDLIYSANPFDQLADPDASDLLGRLAARLAPGGRLVVASHAPENKARGYMEGVMGWSVMYRSELDLERLADSSRLKRFRTNRDAPGNIVYLEVSSAGK
ncbi:MAG TPA: class I SAM-dependent methyltransferase [Bradyrhizobium sp.]|nr:class I SAM-dependent methyltransferase [Bradyrhizobium sp.]